MYQRTGSKNLKRNKQIHSKTKSQSAHTLTLNNGVVLRKSGVATKTNPKKFLPYQALPTPQEVKERARVKANAGKQQTVCKQRVGVGGKRLLTHHIGKKIHNSGHSSRTVTNPNHSNRTHKQTGTTIIENKLSDKTNNTVPDTGSDEDKIPALGGETDIQTPRDQKMPAPADKKKREPRKARLVSYSSRDDSQDDMASRRSGRIRTAVTKWEA